MIKEKLGWDKRIKNISIFLELFLIILLILCIITKQDSEVLVVMSTLCLLEMSLVMYLNFYTIHVYEDHIIIKSLFSSKKYEFKSIIIKEEVSIRILDLENKEIRRIANFLDPKSKIDKAYSRYCKTNNIKHINCNCKITYNTYIKNFSIFGIIFSFIMFIFSGILIYQKLVNIYDDIVMILIFLIFGIIVLIASVIGLLSYINFEISINDNTVTIKNFIAISKNYNTNLLKCRMGNYIYKLKVSRYKTIILPYYLLNNPDILVKIENRY